jgi:stalled ribosome rescue protein Dom34
MIRASEVVFILTREDVIACAKEMGIPEEAITDDVFYKVKKGVESAWEGWPEVVKAAISYALKD